MQEFRNETKHFTIGKKLKLISFSRGSILVKYFVFHTNRYILFNAKCLGRREKGDIMEYDHGCQAPVPVGLLAAQVRCAPRL